MNGTGDSTATALEHTANFVRDLLTHLRRIDRLVQAQVAVARQPRTPESQYQGLFIPEEEVDELLARAPGSVRFPAGAPEESRTTGPVAGEEHSRLAVLARLFELSRFEVDCLLVCLAPELDPRYERLYAYLQDDVTKKRPSVDLVLNLLCPSFEAKMAGWQAFQPGSALIRRKLLQVFEDPSQPYPTLLGKYVKIDDRIVSYLLGSDEPDSRLLPWVTRLEPRRSLEDLVMPAERKRRLLSLVHRNRECGILFYFQGTAGSGRRATAEALCREMQLNLMVVDGTSVSCGDDAAFRGLAPVIAREALLQDAALYWHGFESLCTDDKSRCRSALLRELDCGAGLIFLSGAGAWDSGGDLKRLPFFRVEFERPVYEERVQLWVQALGGEKAEIPGLANKFRFTPGQIEDAAATAQNLACWRDPSHSEITSADLAEACRIHSGFKLATLGRKVKPQHTWNDIVLPDDRLQHLREVCNSVKFRSIVYDQWGFDRKLSLGKGLNILFAGPSGTGKTLAAEIMSGELGLDLYKIDLSTVVSKYIGETEKNLARIFAEAEASNAILFFDEADALFGKRSEVRDSHDRYANIEINYLLQKMEEHEGAVILATNFRKNMDDAFVRRIHFTVEFPFPNEGERRRIWERIWPAETPRACQLDLDLMARRFELAGGNIRNIALAAAFLAASDGGLVNMTHLLHGTRREYQKMGKVVTEGEFGHAAGLA